MPVQTHVKLEGFAELKRDLAAAPELVQGELKKAMRASVQHVKKATVSRAPRSNGPRSPRSVKVGPIRRKISASVRGKGENTQGRVTVKPFYAKIIHKGAKPHTILPRKAKVLALSGGSSGAVYIRRAQHPGFRARPFLDQAFEASKPAIDGYFQAAAANVTKELSGGRRL